MGWRDQITLIALSEPSERTNEHGLPYKEAGNGDNGFR